VYESGTADCGVASALLAVSSDWLLSLIADYGDSLVQMAFVLICLVVAWTGSVEKKKRAAHQEKSRNWRARTSQ